VNVYIQYICFMFAPSCKNPISLSFSQWSPVPHLFALTDTLTTMLLLHTTEWLSTE